MPDPMRVLRADAELTRLINHNPDMLSVELRSATDNLRMIVDNMDAVAVDPDMQKLVVRARTYLEALEERADITGKTIDFLLETQALSTELAETLRDQRDEAVTERDALWEQIVDRTEAREEGYQAGFADAKDEQNLYNEYEVDGVVAEAYDEGHAVGYQEGAAERILNAEPDRGSDAWLLWHTLLSEDERAQWRSGLDPEARADYDAWVSAHASA